MHIFKKVLSLLAKPFVWFRKTRKRNKFFAIIGVLILLGIIGGQIAQLTTPPPYETQKAQIGDVVEIVSETGNVNAGGRVDIYSTATGIIEDLYVKNGEQVILNQPLFTVRSTATEQEKAAAYAAYQTAYSAQKKAEQGKLAADAAMWSAQKTRLDAKEARRVKDEHKDDYEDLEERSIDAADIQGEKDFLAAEKAYTEADIAVNAAKAQATSAWLDYEATKNAVIKATTNGTIANLSVSINDNVSSNPSAAAGAVGLTASAATPVLTIINKSSNYVIKIALNEVDIPKLKQGQPASIKFDAFSGKKFKGSVTHVDAVGTNTQGVVTYNVLVSIHDTAVIKPGMTADVDIEVDKAKNVLTVPNSAVKPYKGGRAVRVIDPKTKELTYLPVEIGIKGETKTEIIKGISEGQQVVTALSNEQVKNKGGLF